MGSFNVGCGMSNLNIEDGDKADVLLLKKNEYSRGNDNTKNKLQRDSMSAIMNLSDCTHRSGMLPDEFFDFYQLGGRKVINAILMMNEIMRQTNRMYQSTFCGERYNDYEALKTLNNITQVIIAEKQAQFEDDGEWD